MPVTTPNETDPTIRSTSSTIDRTDTKNPGSTNDEARNSHGFQHINPLLTECVERIQEAHDRLSEEITGLAYGFEQIDDLTRGLHPGELTLIMGDASIDTTALALNIATNVAVDCKVPVGVFSTKMSESVVTARILCAISGNNYMQEQTGRLSDDDWSRLSFSLGKLHDAPIFVNAGSETTADGISRKVRQFHQQHGTIGLVVIDHLSPINEAQATDPWQYGWGEPLAAYRSLAKDLGISVIATAKVPFSSDDLPNRSHSMQHFRQFCINEKNADVIMLQSRDAACVQGSAGDSEVVRCLVGKQRLGDLGSIYLTYLTNCLAFETDYGRYADRLTFL